MITSINPATGDVLDRYEETTADEIMRRLDAAHHVFKEWRQTRFSERASLMKGVSRVLMEHQDEYARIMALEMGKPVGSGRAEIEKCAWVCEHYAEHAEKMLQAEIIQTDARKSYVTYKPLGLILAIMPWNYPFWQVFRHAAPGLMAGNGVVLKHASNVPGCAVAIEKIQNSRFPAEPFSKFSDFQPAGGRSHRAPRNQGRNFDRQQSRRQGRCRQSRQNAEKNGAGARRQRSLPYTGRRRSG